jgi:dihydrofolate reductase
MITATQEAAVLLTIQTFLSLDGVMQGPGGPEEDRSGGFDQGGWSMPHNDEDFGRIVTEFMGRADAFLLGRRTYDIFASYWPKVDDAEAMGLNTLPKYVASRSARRLDWHNSHLITDVPEEVAGLKAKPGRELQVHGSGDLARTLVDEGLIDEYRLFVYPVVLGAGRRLFEAGVTPTGLRLVESSTTAKGVVVQVYRPTGAPEYGDVPMPS